MISNISKEEREPFCKNKNPLNKLNKVNLGLKSIVLLITSIGIISIFITLLLINSSNKNLDLFPILKHGKWGYINKTGKIIIQPQYDYALDFNESMAGIKINGKWGFINTSGKLVISPQFDDRFTSPQYDGPIPSSFMDLSHHEMEYNHNYQGYFFNDGISRVSIGGKVGFINKAGTVIINPLYDAACDFHEGLASVEVSGRWGFIDNKGKMIINPEYAIPGEFNDGLARVSKMGYFALGFINRSGKVIVNFENGDASEFSEGLAPVSHGGHSSYVNCLGKTVIYLDQLQNCSSFSDGYALISKGNLWGYINKKGDIAISPRFPLNIKNGEFPGNFHEGLAYFALNGLYGYIDKTGKVVIRPQFDKASDFTNGLARVEIGKKIGYINKVGKFIWAPTA